MRRSLIISSVLALALALPMAAQADGNSCKAATLAFQQAKAIKDKACGVAHKPRKKKTHIARRVIKTAPPVEVAVAPPAPVEPPKAVEVASLTLDNALFASAGSVGDFGPYYGGGGSVIINNSASARATSYAFAIPSKPRGPKPPKPHMGGGCGCGQSGGHGGYGGGHK
jgi:hypothetical protein